MRMLGLIMMVVGFTLCVAMGYIIDVGGLPANLALTCGFWGAVGIVGALIFTLKASSGVEKGDHDKKE